MAIETRVEGKRGCGYRKGGGLYLVSGGLAEPCGKMPIPLSVCPTCNAGIKPTRGWTWIDGGALVGDRKCEAVRQPDASVLRDQNPCWHCPLGTPSSIGKIGLLWIGEKFYPTIEDFQREAAKMGVSRRIPAVPKEFALGETSVWLAHRKAILRPKPRQLGTPTAPDLNAPEELEGTPGVFRIFKPQRIEYVVKGDETPDEIERMEKRGITLVKVIPANEAEHQHELAHTPADDEFGEADE